MENLAHSLTGLALARAGLDEKVPFGGVTLVIAANLPDADVVAGYFGELYYLHYHRGVTHSLLGTVILGLLLGALAWLLRRYSRAPDVRLSSSMGAALAAAATHPLLDFTNSYGLWPYLPFSDSAVYGDLVFIVDPFMWVILGSGVILSARQGRGARIVWTVGTAAALGLLGFFATVEVRAVWAILAIAAAAGTVLLLRGRRFGPRAAALSLVGLFAYWSFLLVSHHSAWFKVLGEVREDANRNHAQPVSVLPRPVDPLNWTAFYTDGTYLYTGQTSSFSDEETSFVKIPTNRAKPEVQAALQTCPGKVLSLFGRFEYYSMDHGPQGPVVTFRDARFAFDGSDEEGFGTWRIPLTEALELAPTETPCPDMD